MKREETLRCDLCNDRKKLSGITYTYVTENEASTAAEADRDGTFWAEDPDWAVCQQCHELIEMGSLERLIAYAIDRQVGSTLILGGPPGLEEKMKADMSQEIRRILTLFWAQRCDRFPEPGHRISP